MFFTLAGIVVAALAASLVMQFIPIPVMRVKVALGAVAGSAAAVVVNQNASDSLPWWVAVVIALAAIAVAYWVLKGISDMFGR